MPPEPEPLLMTPDDAARRLAVSKTTLWKLVAAGSIPQPIRFSRKNVKFRVADLSRWAESAPPTTPDAKESRTCPRPTTTNG